MLPPSGVDHTNLCSLNYTPNLDWMCLPPRLQHLCTYTVKEGPQPCLKDGRPVLGSLLSLEAENDRNAGLPLHAFVQILQAAPAFRRLHTQLGTGAFVKCRLGPTLVEGARATDASDLAFLLTKVEAVPTILDATLCMLSIPAVRHALTPIIAGQPVMAGITRCDIMGDLHQDTNRGAGDLGPLLQAFS